MFDCGMGCEFVGAVGFCDFATAFPVVDDKGGPPPRDGSFALGAALIGGCVVIIVDS